jgi:ADP-ribose diphosphatase
MSKNKHLISSKLEYSNPYYSIYKEKILLPDNRLTDYYLYHTATGKFVSIIALNAGKIVLLKQWRPTIKKWHWEFPAGAVDKDETEIESAKREFLEETGYMAKKWKKIGEFYVGVGHTDQKGIVVLAQDFIKKSKQNLEESEIIEVVEISIDKFEQMIKNKQIDDGPSLAAWMMYKSRK